MRPVRFDYIRRFVQHGQLHFLDVGCGNHSPSLTKKYFPDSAYHGIDLVPAMNNDPDDLACMEEFYQMNIENGDFGCLRDEHYDCIILSHILEHVSDGHAVLGKLIPKLKMEGLIYIETPSERSEHFPSMTGTLNFWDDPTHVRIYSVEGIKTVLVKNGCDILMARTRRSLKRVLLFPMHIVFSLWKHKHVSGTVFWDILGFANVIIARRSR